ncbi:hypothetical protein GCM10023228_25160 [Brevibacillus fulvus]
MFRYLAEEGLIDANPFDNVKPVEENDNEIQIMSVEQLKRLLAAPNQRRYSGFRDYVIMNVLLDGFLRINDALSL